jgi:hypothetical protein
LGVSGLGLIAGFLPKILQFLEHIIGSQSLVAAVGHAITLQSLNLLTIGLLAIWALSPLGGQSALRLLRESRSIVIGSRPVFYASVYISGVPRLDGQKNMMNQINGVVSTALGTADTLEFAPMDTWKHPKVPRIDELERAEEANSTDRPWYTANHDANVSYASLTGISVTNLMEAGATNFTVLYEYMYFGCGLLAQNNILTNKTSRGVLISYSNTTTQLEYLRDLNTAGRLYSAGQFLANAADDFPPDGTDYRSFLKPNGTNERYFFFYTIYASNATRPKANPETIIYGSKGFYDSGYYLFECSMKSVQVEANIVCEADVCRVDRLRRFVPRRLSYASNTPYDVIHNAETNKDFIGSLRDIGGIGSWERPNPVDSWIFGNAPWGEVQGENLMNNWTQYVAEPQKSLEMSRRLTRVLNTFWEAYRWPIAIIRNDPYAAKTLNETSGKPLRGLTMAETEATTTRQIPIYRAEAGWMACLVICSTILLLLGIFSVTLSLCITVPDIFDYVSSFTRDNPYIIAPDTGSSLDGAERARLLRKLPVQLGDTDVDAGTGYIALRSIEDSKDCEQGKVRKDRKYR